MIAHVYNVNAKKSGDITYLNSDTIKFIMELENTKITKNASLFRKLIYNLWTDCIINGAYPQDNPDTIKVQYGNSTYYYSIKKIIKNQHWILLYLNKLHVLDPQMLADGTKWTEVRQPIELLMSMGNAVAQNIQLNNKKTR